MTDRNSNQDQDRDQDVTQGGIDTSGSDDTSGVYAHAEDVNASDLWNYLMSNR